jgi:galactokinase
VAVAGALSRLSEIEIDRKRLALICQKAENRFVGVNCGIMDQFASALGVEGHALLIDCRDLTVEPIAMPEGIAIVVIDSKVERKLGDTAFNRRREECDEAAAALGVRSLRDATMESLDALEMDSVLARRARHVITENGRVAAMAEALRGDDRAEIGRLMTESHESLRADFEVSTPELDALVAIAGGIEGVIGARMTGAGFGGCTVNLAKAGAVAGFEAAILPEYERRTGLRAEVHVCNAPDGLQVSDA